MLPNQSSEVNQGTQGHHQRQNSTTTDFDNLKISTSPRHVTHHRGLSYDQMMLCHGLPMSFQEDSTTTTNQKHMQHAIPETQPRPMARPGQRRNNSDDGTLRPSKLATNPYTGTGCFKNDLSFTQINDMTEQDLLSFLSASNDQSNTSHSFFSSISAGSLDGNGNKATTIAEAIQQNHVEKYEIPDSAETSRRSSVQYVNAEPQRPCTPPAQSNYCLFPMTPDQTPHRTAKRNRDSRTASPRRPANIGDPNQTIRAAQPLYLSCKEVFGDGQSFHRLSSVPSPPASASLEPPNSFTAPDFPPSAYLDLSTETVNFTKIDYTSSHCSPMSSALSPTMQSFQSSPEVTSLAKLEATNESIADFTLFPEPSLPTSHSVMDLGSYSPHRHQKSSHSRAQSASGIDAGLATVDTGISLEEVNAFIGGPNDDQKWSCMYPECGKKFGRKENIKSHVQTHLGDRQFLCIHCNKRFVRQHDLKRHEKIHTGVKPYPCECGHSFARMDALTRHKQRNTCVGGIGGPDVIEKKEIRRGRPRKHRPDTEERLDKASRTRQRVLEKKTASSVSGSSVCSFSSPPAMPDGYDTDASAAFPSTPQMFLNYDTDASAPMSRGTSSSHYGTPPGLDMTSSSPIASKFFDFDEIAEPGTEVTNGAKDPISSELASSLVLTQAEPDLDQMLLEFNSQAQSPTIEVKDNGMGQSQVYMNTGEFGFLEEDPFGLGHDYSPRFDELKRLETVTWCMGTPGDF